MQVCGCLLWVMNQEATCPSVRSDCFFHCLNLLLLILTPNDSLEQIFLKKDSLYTKKNQSHATIWHPMLCYYMQCHFYWNKFKIIWKKVAHPIFEKFKLKTCKLQTWFLDKTQSLSVQEISMTMEIVLMVMIIDWRHNLLGKK